MAMQSRATRIPAWFATDTQYNMERNNIRFRIGLECKDGFITITDLVFTADTYRMGSIDNTQHEVLSTLHEYITKQLATLELEKE